VASYLAITKRDSSSVVCLDLRTQWRDAGYSRDFLVELWLRILFSDALSAHPEMVSVHNEEMMFQHTPVIKVMSGIGGNGDDVLRFDQLWFELPERSERDKKQPAKTSDRRLRRKIGPRQDEILTGWYSNVGR
jgi:hypothetical protein